MNFIYLLRCSTAGITLGVIRIINFIRQVTMAKWFLNK